MNVLLLMCDQLRADVLDPQSPCQMPHLQSLIAEHGVKFDYAYTPNAICSPARASMMTGQYPSRHGMVDVTHNVKPYRADLVHGLQMWSEHLTANGYVGGYFGKWHIERTENPRSYGFHEAVLVHSEAYKEYRTGLGLGDSRLDPEYNLIHSGYDVRPLYGVYDEPAESTEPYYLYSLGIDFIKRQQEQGQKWFATVSLLEPHDPYLVPRAYYEKYDPDQLQIPANLRDDLQGKPNILRRLQMVWKDMTNQEIKESLACYYGLCTLIDDQIGRMVHYLKESGQLDDTLIIFTSDHGDMLGNHGLFLKGVTPYEEVYRIPFVVAGAGVRNPGRSCTGKVSLVDMAPTIAELCTSTRMKDVDGKSLVPLLNDEVLAARMEDWEEAFAEFHGQRLSYSQRLVWYRNYKYIFNGFDLDELYDLEQDPAEMNNLADKEGCQELYRDMVRRMWRMVRKLGDHSLNNSHYGMFRFLPEGPYSAIKDKE